MSGEPFLFGLDGKFVTLRVAYPMGFFAKGLDGRIDDPKAGWKGWAMVHLGQQSAVSHGNRQRNKTQSREVADSPRSAGEVDGASNG
jgi:hypothetical protein